MNQIQMLRSRLVTVMGKNESSPNVIKEKREPLIIEKELKRAEIAEN